MGKATFGDVGNAIASNPMVRAVAGYAGDLANFFPAGAMEKAVGGAAADTAKNIAGAALPTINEGLRDVGNLALKHKIPLSVDQISDSAALKNIQKVSQELPFSGQPAFRNKQMKAFNRALLSTVGVDGEKITKKVMKDAFSKVGSEFEKLGAGKTFQIGKDFDSKINEILADNTAIKDSIGHFNREVKRVRKNADAAGNIPGETLNSLRSRVNKIARETNNPDTADLLHQLEVAIIDTMVGGDEVAKAAFSQTKKKYKNLLAIEPLTTKGRAGNISPSQLNQRVSKIYGRSHAIGEAGDIGELAQIGHELLPELGGSDTVQKLIYAGKAAAGVGASGTAAALAPLSTATALGVNRAAQSGINRNQALVKKMIKGKK
jgi:hypothetical protein